MGMVPKVLPRFKSHVLEVFFHTTGKKLVG